MGISLTNAEQYLQGSNVIELNDTCCSTSAQIDFSSGTLAFSIQSGRLSGSVFTAGSRSRNISVTINVQAGTWASGAQTGTITPVQQTQLNTFMTNARNSMETFSIANNLVLGTQVPWTMAG
jgi:hypothetical protein